MHSATMRIVADSPGVWLLHWLPPRPLLVQANLLDTQFRNHNTSFPISSVLTLHKTNQHRTESMKWMGPKRNESVRLYVV